MAHSILRAVAIGFLALAYPLVALLLLAVWLAMGIARDDA